MADLLSSPLARRLLATTADPLASAGLAVLRTYVGLAILVAHAGPKLGEMLAGEGHFPELVADMGFPAPTFFAWLATVAQLGGALAVIAGAATRLGAVSVLSTLGIGIAGVHWGDPFAVVEAGLAYLATLLALALAGGGAFSVDHRLSPPPPALAGTGPHR